MLAKCSRCTQTFQTDRYGEQFCPFCGASVMIAGPAGTGPGPFPPPGPGSPGQGMEGPQDQEAPMDQTAAHGGLVSAFLATWKQAVFEPQSFFSRLRVGDNWGGALTFALICLVIGGIFAGPYLVLQLAVQVKTMPYEARKALKPLLAAWPLVALGFAVLMPIASAIGLFINAGLMHLGLKIVGGAKNGFTATFRAVGYAQGPQLFVIVPVCGSMIAGIWTIVLTIIGLANLHRISVGRAVGAWVVTLCLTCCCIGGPIAGLISFAAYQAQRRPAYDYNSHKVDLPPMGDLPDSP